MIVEKPVLKLFLRSVTTGSNSGMNQSGFLLVQCAGKSRIQDVLVLIFLLID